MTISRTTVRAIIRQGAVIAVGSFVAACGINIFLKPHHFLTGGASGLALLVSYLTPLSVGLWVFIINIPIVILGFRYAHRIFMIGSLWGTLLFAVFLETTSWMNGLNVTHEPFIAAIFGGTLVGVGTGLAFRANASLGGPDVIAAVMRKRWSTSIGTITFLFNAAIVIAGGALFGMEIALATIIGLAMQALFTDRVMAGFDESKAIFVMSEKHQDIADFIMKKMGRGVTFLDGEGAYLHQKRRVVYAVITLPQVARLKFYVRSVDPNAFLVVADVTEVQGSGFKAVQI